MAFTGIGAAALIAGGAIAGGAMQADAARDASATQAGATNRSTALTNAQYNIARGDQAPYRASGKSALQQLMAFMGLAQDPQQVAGDAYLKANPDVAANAGYSGNPYQHYLDAGRAEGRIWPTADPAATAADPNAPLARKFSVDDFWQDPVTQLGYQQGLDLGTKAMKNIAPLTFGTDSGAAIKEATKFGQDYAGSKADQSYARFEGDKSNVFNRLMAMIGGGQVSNQVTTGAGTNAANTNAALITAGGNAQGAARIAQGNAASGALGNISNWWQQNQALDRMFPQSTPASNFAYNGFGRAGDYQYG